MRVVVGETPDAPSYRCSLNGKDVSERCFAADDAEGWVDLWPRDYAQAGGPTRRHYGRVELWRPA